MKSTHYDEIMAKMPEFCWDPKCDTRKHHVDEDCPVYLNELRTLQAKDMNAFLEADQALPKNDHNASIKYDRNTEQVIMSLDAFLALAKNFQGKVEYGIKQTHGGEGGEDTTIYSLAGMPFKDARDLAEVAGKQLMQKFDSGWMEA